MTNKWGGGDEGVCSMDTLDKGMIRLPTGMEQDGERFHQATQNGTQFKTVYFQNFLFNISIPPLTVGN